MYTLKELEKLAPKSKGIIAMSVEEVLTSLVNDDEVLTDKIGTSNYFWVFASHERATVCSFTIYHFVQCYFSCFFWLNSVQSVCKHSKKKSQNKR